ncbi:hypothetical protein APA_4118 [Pseudanabaena sp. lw0831]|nr:hypothetical protein APA_4118 [Pseudanabaena sp. lw0831]
MFLPPKSPNSGGLESGSPQNWGARGAEAKLLKHTLIPNYLLENG